MSAIGGSIESLILKGRNFPVSADAEAQRKLGGFENEVLPNGDGSARIQKTRVAWALTGVAIEIDDSRGDHEYVQNLADSKELFPVAIVYASGKVYQGVGMLTGETQTSSQSASMPVNLMGQGVLTPQ